MKLIEHLEYIIGLVDRPASQSEIKGALLAMREEIEGYERAAAENVDLAKKYADLKASQPPEPTKMKISLGPKFPRQPV